VRLISVPIWAAGEDQLAIDYLQFSENLHRFHDFTNKVVLFVGAGGRQLLDPTIKTKKIFAIDRDREALKQLEQNIALIRQASVDIVCAEFEDIKSFGDVVYFEFCLHEMVDPQKALTHAKTIAPDVVVFDHLPDSDWVFYAAEENEVRHSSAAIDKIGVRRRQTFRAEQRFEDHAELVAKLIGQGPTAVQRAQRFLSTKNIVIPMSYQLVLL
jgi:hypothetical protein